ETKYETNEPLSYYEKKLSHAKFIRIHRASIINKKHIQSVEHWFNSTYQVTLTHGIKLQVSRSYMKLFKAEIGLVYFGHQLIVTHTLNIASRDENALFNSFHIKITLRDKYRRLSL